MWKLVSSLKRACAGVEMARRPCRYSEHRPNVGRVYILRKCVVRAMSSKRWGVFFISLKDAPRKMQF